MGYRIFDPEDYINQKMSDLNFLWHDQKMNIGSQYFLDFKYKFKKIRKKILFFPCHTFFNQELDNPTNNNNIFLNQIFNLAKLLNIKKI